jgi:hypothetical protein
MAKTSVPMSNPIGGSALGRVEFIGAEASFLPVRMLTRETPPDGAHVACVAKGDDGHSYYCKDDRAGEPIRMREAVFSLLAHAVGLPSPGFSVLEDEVTGETFFGSRRHISTADNDQRKRFLRTTSKDELGQCSTFPGGFFSRLFIFDMFINNSDRSADNIVAIRDGRALRLCPIDFSLAELGKRPFDHFPIERSETFVVARQLRGFHGFSNRGAADMLASIDGIKLPVFKSFFRGLPAEWIDVGERETLCELWAGDALQRRLAMLGASIADGEML